MSSPKFQQGDKVYTHDGAVCTVWQDPVPIQDTFAYWLELADGSIILCKEEDIAGRFQMPKGRDTARRMPDVQLESDPPMPLHPGCLGTDEACE